jgi:hypothetical protein
VSLSLFDYIDETGKVNFTNSLIENLHHINSTFTHLCVIFENRYAQNEDSFLFAKDVDTILKEACTNITVKKSFALKKKIYLNIFWTLDVRHLANRI